MDQETALQLKLDLSRGQDFDYQVLRLRIEGYSRPEVAKHLGVSVSTVARSYSRAVRRFGPVVRAKLRRS